MLKRHTFSVSFLCLTLGFTSLASQAAPNTQPPTRAILLNPIQGDINQAEPQAVNLLITEGQAKGCKAEGSAYLNKQRKRYEYNLAPIHCIKNGQVIPVGQVVRGQHNIKGTMANSGMGRTFFVTNKGVTVTLTNQ